MFRMEKITTGIAYGASGGGTGYWLLQLLDKVSPSQWAAIGVLGSLMFGLLTWLPGKKPLWPSLLNRRSRPDFIDKH